MKTLILIPSRLSATRLPGKPLLKINGLSIISHVIKKAQDANIGDVYVATEDQEIMDDVKQNGGQAILTSKNHKTGTDRIFEAIKKLNKLDIELVMNLQGDEPLISIEDIKNLHNKMIKSKYEMGTLASNILNKDLYLKENLVKVITKKNLDNLNFPEAVNFVRKLNNYNQNIYHHLGVYCFQLETLRKFVSFKQTQNEIDSNLEQLRALDNGLKINVSLARESTIGVDTKEDFVAIKKIMEYKS
jgi:3-deoxy-manno-octulosonate cytidylyltransferase (CMP-KDO synthetase)